MAWFWIFSALFLIIKFITSPPNIVVGWALKKFELHQQLDPNQTTITFNDNDLGKEAKQQFTSYINESIFLKKHYIFPGHENLFLEPKTDIPPFIVNVTKGNKNVQYVVYSTDGNVNIVKQYKKKVIAYSVHSEKLLNYIHCLLSSLKV